MILSIPIEGVDNSNVVIRCIFFLPCILSMISCLYNSILDKIYIIGILLMLLIAITMWLYLGDAYYISSLSQNIFTAIMLIFSFICCLDMLFNNTFKLEDKYRYLIYIVILMIQIFGCYFTASDKNCTLDIRAGCYFIENPKTLNLDYCTDEYDIHAKTIGGELVSCVVYCVPDFSLYNEELVKSIRFRYIKNDDARIMFLRLYRYMNWLDNILKQSFKYKEQLNFKYSKPEVGYMMDCLYSVPVIDDNHFSILSQIQEIYTALLSTHKEILRIIDMHNNDINREINSLRESRECAKNELSELKHQSETGRVDFDKVKRLSSQVENLKIQIKDKKKAIIRKPVDTDAMDYFYGEFVKIYKKNKIIEFEPKKFKKSSNVQKINLESLQ